MNKEFIRVRSTKDITLSTIILAAGTVCIVLPLPTSVKIFGFVLLFTGIVLFLTCKTAYKDTETGVKYSKKERFFAQGLRQSISDAIASKPENVNLAEEDKGNGVRLDIYHSKEAGKAYVQLFEYIPYKYEPCSVIYEYEVSEVNNLIK